MPCLPPNLHLVTTSHSADNAIRKKRATRHVESAAPAILPRKMTSEVSKVLPLRRKMQRIV